MLDWHCSRPSQNDVSSTAINQSFWRTDGVNEGIMDTARLMTILNFTARTLNDWPQSRLMFE
jgi:hypothetical protein